MQKPIPKQPLRRALLSFALISGLLTAGTGLAATLDEEIPTQRTEVQSFIDEMATKHGFDRDELTAIFEQVRMKQKIIDAITRPAEGKPWHEYRPIFVTKTRISEGVKFWNENEVDLKRAEQVYGVPPEIIVAIIGVETRYGRHKGGWRVLDSLSTLAFAYPKRAKFFRSELEQYLLLAREESLDPLSIKGSYAGAMGKAQFISSSYRNFAVDFDGDGKRDLWNNTTDAIGSVANYFKRHKWQPGEPVGSYAMVGSNRITRLLKAGIKPHTTVKEFRQQGVTALTPLPPEAPAALIAFEKKVGRPDYWLGLNNFYTITRYNHSPLYAMAVYQLGQAISAERDG
ncbi:MAG TPA: lytic murein transglycosylase B [Chromatiales bacterium]|nr:lytic murein transglycosylase B [Chromatiales bacterium]HEX23102.1 lytic murein transglycosylase B [Chromatiales bacterium]